MSIAGQARLIERIADAADMELLSVIREEGSAYEGSMRGAFQRVLQGEEAWDVLIVSSLDRVSRSWPEWLELLEWFETHGKTLFSAEGELDMSTADGWLLGMFKIVLACYESKRLSERIRAGIEAKKAKGLPYHDTKPGPMSRKERAQGGKHPYAP